MERIKTPLLISTFAYAIAFMGGALEWNLSDDTVVLLGFVEIIALIWMLWIVFGKSKHV